LRLVFLGPPGAGKGTQAVQQAEQRGLRYIATGDELRKAIAAGTPLGQQAKAYTTSGCLVPDEVIIGLVCELLEAPGSARGVVFDGFPRTMGQAEALDRLLQERGEALDAVLYFDVPGEAVVQRLSGRRVCRRCGATFHVATLPSKRDGLCDHCGGELHQRDDDKPETIANRLRVYHDQTAGLLDYYRARGLLVRLAADRTIEEVRAAVDAAIASAQARGGPGGTATGQGSG
jgi:adenylate kinase